MNGEPIPRANSVKDLGVHFDRTLKFDVHVEATVNKAFRSLGFLIRTSRSFRCISSVLHLYRALVAPQLEYACPIWSPYYVKYIDAIESVQRRFTRFVFRKFNLSYCDYDSRCKWLKIMPLRRRRILHDQMLLFNIVRRRVNTNPQLVPIVLRLDSSTRNRDRFVERFWRLRSTYSSTLPRMIRHYNRLFTYHDIFTESRRSFRSMVSFQLKALQTDPD